MTDQNKTHGVLTDRQMLEKLRRELNLTGHCCARCGHLDEESLLEVVHSIRDHLAAPQSPVAPAPMGGTPFEVNPAIWAHEQEHMRATKSSKTVAPADERAAKAQAMSNSQIAEILRTDASGGSSANVWIIDEAAKRLADAPTVSATLTQLRDAAAPLGFALVPLIPTSAMNDVFATEDWRWSDLLAEAEAIDEAQQAFVDENENAAPTPPTSAADAAIEQRDIAIQMLAEWCCDIDRNGTGWDDWDENYKNAKYRPGPLRNLLDAAIAANKKESGDE